MQPTRNHFTDSQKTDERKELSPSSEGQGTSKEIMILAVGLIVLVIGIGGAMMYSENEDLHVKKTDTAQAYSSYQKSNTVSTPTSTLSLPVAYATPSPTIPNPTSIDQTVYFDFNQALLSEESQTQLKDEIQQIQDKDELTLTIRGYTDQQGPDTYNQALGLKRAEAVKQYLVSLGMPADSIQVESLGKEGALCTEETEACYQQNRRAHLALINPDAQGTESNPVVTESIPTVPEEKVNPEELPTTLAESDQEQASETDSTIEVVEEAISSDEVATAVTTP